MTATEFRKMSDKEKNEVEFYLLSHESFSALKQFKAYKEFLDKTVEVHKGRKVAIGTIGTVFWVGVNNYTNCSMLATVTLGIKDSSGNVYFTNQNNCKLIK